MGLITGLVEQRFTNIRMGLSAHLEGVMNGIFLVALGAIWNRELFLGHIVLRHFARSDFLRYIVGGFDSVDYLGLERVAYFDKFADAF